MDWRAKDLQGAELHHADLQVCVVDAPTRLVGSYSEWVQGANMKGANLKKARLDGSNLHICNMSGADLTGASLQGATLTNCNFDGAKLKGADLTDANYDVETCVERGWLKVYDCINGFLCLVAWPNPHPKNMALIQLIVCFFRAP